MAIINFFNNHESFVIIIIVIIICPNINCFILVFKSAYNNKDTCSKHLTVNWNFNYRLFFSRHIGMFQGKIKHFCNERTVYSWHQPLLNYNSSMSQVIVDDFLVGFYWFFFFLKKKISTILTWFIKGVMIITIFFNSWRIKKKKWQDFQLFDDCKVNWCKCCWNIDSNQLIFLSSPFFF